MEQRANKGEIKTNDFRNQICEILEKYVKFILFQFGKIDKICSLFIFS